MKTSWTYKKNHRSLSSVRALGTRLSLPIGKGGCIGSVLIVVALTAFIHISISSASDPKAENLPQLIEMFDTSRCKECHGEIYAQWEKSHHARSIMDIFMDRYLQEGVLSIKTPRDATRKNFPCFQCHLPQLAYATDKVASEIATAILNNDKATMGKLNINCLVCHHQKGGVLPVC